MLQTSTKARGAAVAMIPNRGLAQRRDLVIELVRRDLRLRYRRSILGLTWSMLNPLLQFVVFYAVFRYVIPVAQENFALFLFPGLLAWSWLQGSLQFGCTAIVDHASLLRQPSFPASTLPLVTVVSTMLHFLLALPIAIGAAAWSGTLAPVALLGLPLVIVVQFTLTLALVYMMASLHVAFRDTQYLLGVLVLIGFYASPVLYAPSVVPEVARTLYWLNPMVAILDSYHRIFVDGRFPALAPLAAVAVIAAIALALAYRYFTHASRWFVEELG